MRKISSLILTAGLLAFTSPSYAQEPIDCNKCEEVLRTHERAYLNLVKAQDYFQEYLKERQTLGTKFSNEQLGAINYLFLTQRFMEKTILEEIRKYVDKNCPTH